MFVPDRILRAEAESFNRDPNPFTAREAARHELIIETGQRLLARHGRHAITIRGLAVAVNIGTATLRRHFVDIEALLGEILRRHLVHLARAIGAVPHKAANRDTLRRAAYLAATRTPLGGLTEAHLLLVRDRHELPPDERASIEETRDHLGEMIAPGHGEAAFVLLDAPVINPALIDAILGLIQAAEIAPAAEPAVAALPAPEPTAFARRMAQRRANGNGDHSDLSWVSGVFIDTTPPGARYGPDP